MNSAESFPVITSPGTGLSRFLRYSGRVLLQFRSCFRRGHHHLFNGTSLITVPDSSGRTSVVIRSIREHRVSLVNLSQNSRRFSEAFPKDFRQNFAKPRGRPAEGAQRLSPGCDRRAGVSRGEEQPKRAFERSARPGAPEQSEGAEGPPRKKLRRL